MNLQCCSPINWSRTRFCSDAQNDPSKCSTIRPTRDLCQSVGTKPHHRRYSFKLKSVTALLPPSYTSYTWGGLIALGDVPPSPP
jgi:hypothetical protein